MIQYEENTIGWWLSQLKEPLKSRALGIVVYPPKPCDNLDDAIMDILEDLPIDSSPWIFWRGVYVYYFGGFHISGTNFKDGYDLAYECDPWRGGKEIVDSPASEIPVTEDSGSLADFHFPKIVKSDALPPNHFVGIGDDGNPFIGKLSTSIIPPTWEIEAPERAVVGYEEPKPIDTIEKKHELRIKNLEAYNKYQAERNQQIMDLNPHVDFCDSEGNLVRPSRMTALEARVKELEDQLFKLLGSKNG